MRLVFIMILSLNIFANEYMSKCFQENNARDCYELSITFLDKEDYLKAYIYMDKSCKNDYIFSCKKQSILLNKLEKECNKNNSKSCLGLGNIKEYLQNINEAYALYDKSCNLNNFKACSYKSHLIYQNYLKNKTINKEYFYKLSKKSCDNKEAQGCKMLGKYYENIEKNMKKSKKYYEKACIYGDNNMCLAKYLTNYDFIDLISLLSKNCDNHFYPSCLELSYLYKDKISKKYYEKACNVGNFKCDENYLKNKKWVLVRKNQD